MTQAPITLRPAHADDALCLGVLATQVYLDTYAPQGIRPVIARDVLDSFSTAAMQAVIERPRTQLLVAEREGHLVAFAQWALGVHQALVPALQPAQLERLYVQEPFTRQGIGNRLLVECEARARQAGADWLWLTAWAHNQRALAFYPRHGYHDHGTAWYVVESERHENRVLAKALPTC